MMCTPFLVHTYAFAYDVHDVFSVHLCHTAREMYVCLFFPLLSTFFVVYTNSIHSLGALQYYNSWNFTGIPDILAKCCLDDGDIKECLLHIIWNHVNYHWSLITRMVIKGIRVSLYLSLHVYAMIVIEIMCFAPWAYCVKIPMGYTKRIH